MPRIQAIERHEFVIEHVDFVAEDRVAVTVTLTSARRVVGEDEQPHHVEFTVRDRDTWLRTQQGWKLALSDRLDESWLIDGKPRVE
jgi:hypothetical protein